MTKKYAIRKKDKKIIILDSNHTKEHVLNELDIYSKILNKGDALLMPYKNKVFYNESLSDDIGNFHSPLKMFEYLASGKLLISSNRKVLKEILKNKLNCLIVKKNNINSWLDCIKYAENNLKKINQIAKYAKTEVQKYSWDLRIKNILSNR